jgi:CHRD domain-containing protein
MKRLALMALAVLVPAFASVSGVAADDKASHFKARLIGYQEVPSVSTVASGEFSAQISGDEQTIDYELTYGNLQGTVTQAHIHFGQRAVNGGIVIWLCGTAATPTAPPGTQTCPQSGTITGTITAANVVASGMTTQQLDAGELDEVIAAMRAGVTYANVHTSPRSPGGEIRGQIRRSQGHHD